MLLEGKVGIVSGVGPGIGRETALAFARHGADVALGARTLERLDEVRAEVEALGRRAVAVRCDITDADACRDLADTAAKELGRVDVLVNNAFMHPPFSTVEDADLDSWRVAWKVNVIGTVQMTRAALTHMIGGASVVFVNSMAARTSEEHAGAYSSTKAALLSTVRTLAREVGPRGIRVNSVVPGWVMGPNLQSYFDHLAAEQDRSPDDVYQDVARQTALHRIPTSEEIAGAILFLASDLSSGITGQALDVNAGHHFH